MRSFFVVRRILFALALLGLGVSGYLLFAYVTSGPVVCGLGHGCDVVRASQYSSFLGLPTPLYGVVFYFVLGVLAALWSSANASVLRLPLRVVTSVGVGVSAYLTYLEAFVIDAWCVWCVASAVLALLAFVLVWFRLIWK